MKWAGGKRQLIPILNENLPRTFGTYYEPFIGGGALLFHILTERNAQKCNISSLNSDLVLNYATIRNRIDDLISSLKNHEKIVTRIQNPTIIQFVNLIQEVRLRKHQDCFF